MKQSHGGLSVDRSFRAWSINTNLYWILLLPPSLSSLPLTVIPSLYAGFLPPQATSTLTLRAAGVWGRWMLYPHRGKLLALSISPPRRREKRWGKVEREGKHPSKNQEKEKAVLSAQTTSICCNPTLQMGLQKRISYKPYSGTVNQMVTFICAAHCPFLNKVKNNNTKYNTNNSNSTNKILHRHHDFKLPLMSCPHHL